jgi:hypothetical protein
LETPEQIAARLIPWDLAAVSIYPGDKAPEPFASGPALRAAVAAEIERANANGYNRAKDEQRDYDKHAERRGAARALKELAEWAHSCATLYDALYVAEEALRRAEEK